MFIEESHITTRNLRQRAPEETNAMDLSVLKFPVVTIATSGVE